MEKIKSLLKDFLDGTLKPMDFVDQYIRYADTLKDDQHAFVRAHPLISSALIKLMTQYKKKEISLADSVAEVYRLVKDHPLPPHSPQDVIVWHLYVEADAYRDPEDDPDPWTIDEKTLREEVQKGLDELHEIEHLTKLFEQSSMLESKILQEQKLLLNNTQHRQLTHLRWLSGQVDLNRDMNSVEFRRNHAEWSKQHCFMCQFYVRLQGKLGVDWGVCSNNLSVRDGKLTYDRDGCEHFSLTEDEEEL